MRTVDQVISDLKVFTDEQRALAFCPLPRHESTGGSDCRIGGSMGISLSQGSLRDRVIQARFRYAREQRRI